jgi:hypothetical protein
MTVAVLGCGPAGLIAAHGVVMASNEVHIFSKARKSFMYGAQYLHEPIPGISNQDRFKVVDYQLRGSVEDYRRKVYGNLPPLFQSSVEALESAHAAWDIREAYDRLWSWYGGSVVNIDLSDHDAIKSIIKGHEIVISSIPAPLLCEGHHQFRSEGVWAAGEAHDIGRSLQAYQCPDNTVICNGWREPSWYRLSNVFGYKTAEWPGWMKKPPFGEPARVEKPLATNCDCWPSIIRVGRYGKWKKGALSHEAYGVAFKVAGAQQGIMFS